MKLRTQFREIHSKKQVSSAQATKRCCEALNLLKLTLENFSAKAFTAADRNGSHFGVQFLSALWTTRENRAENLGPVPRTKKGERGANASGKAQNLWMKFMKFFRWSLNFHPRAIATHQKETTGNSLRKKPKKSAKWRTFWREDSMSFGKCGRQSTAIL